MKISMQTSIAGHAEPLYDLPEFSFSFGDIVEVDERLAEAWITSGIAIAVPAEVSEATSKATRKPKVQGK